MIHRIETGISTGAPDHIGVQPDGDVYAALDVRPSHEITLDGLTFRAAG